jgi:hypothetical protein
MNFSSQRQQVRTQIAKVIFNRMNLENIRIEEFKGEIYLNGDSRFGQVSLVVKVRGGMEYLTLPKELKTWKKGLK